MAIREKIRAYYDSMSVEHDRGRSWEHCYGYFHGMLPAGIRADRHHAALQLGFYLASWGMYRGSGFLLKHAYTIHLAVIDQVVAPRFSVLWKQEFGAGDSDVKLVPDILDAIKAVRAAYEPFALACDSRHASDTLITKVILGTFGCLPACDRFFIDGFRSSGLSYSHLNNKFVERVLQFSRDNLAELLEEQKRIECSGGMRYPLMKLVDMYFWQVGYDHGPVSGGAQVYENAADL